MVKEQSPPLICHKKFVYLQRNTNVLFHIVHKNRAEHKETASLKLRKINAIDPALQMLWFICTSNNLTLNLFLI